MLLALSHIVDYSVSFQRCVLAWLKSINNRHQQYFGPGFVFPGETKLESSTNIFGSSRGCLSSLFAEWGHFLVAFLGQHDAGKPS